MQGRRNVAVRQPPQIGHSSEKREGCLMRGAWSPPSWSLRAARAGAGAQGGSRNSSSLELHGPWLHQEGIQELVDPGAARHMPGTSCQTAGRATGAGWSLCLVSTLLRLDGYGSQSPADISVERSHPTLGIRSSLACEWAVPETLPCTHMHAFVPRRSGRSHSPAEEQRAALPTCPLLLCNGLEPSVGHALSGEYNLSGPQGIWGWEIAPSLFFSQLTLWLLNITHFSTWVFSNCCGGS